jgi:hypothetical protein
MDVDCTASATDSVAVSRPGVACLHRSAILLHDRRQSRIDQVDLRS